MKDTPARFICFGLVFAVAVAPFIFLTSRILAVILSLVFVFAGLGLSEHLFRFLIRKGKKTEKPIPRG
jgi:hypothetical protein